MNTINNVLSVFDGMSCGQIALNNLGIKYENYFSSEIDKHAIKVTQHNYPKTIQLGNVLDICGNDLPKIDLLIGGSPCQGFSFAGKGLNFEDPRSKLFFEFVRLLKECNPKFFLLENVKMKQEYQDIISEQLGVNPILINSSLVSAQNRERLYWTNIQNVVSPTDKHIYIKDILQPELDIDYIDNFKNCVRKNMIGIEISKYVKNSGFAQIPVKSGFQDHKVGITKSPCLRAGNPFCLVETKSGGIRRLTPLECERLQNVPENYTNIVADTHRYSMLGNGWTVGVIEHIFKNICS